MPSFGSWFGIQISINTESVAAEPAFWAVTSNARVSTESTRGAVNDGVSVSIGSSVTGEPAVWRHSIDAASHSVTVADKVTR